MPSSDLREATELEREAPLLAVAEPPSELDSDETNDLKKNETHSKQSCQIIHLYISPHEGFRESQVSQENESDPKAVVEDSDLSLGSDLAIIERPA